MTKEGGTLTANKECYKMTIEEAMEAVKQIIRRGNDAEIRRCRGGLYIVYEVQKNKLTVTSRVGDE